MTVEDIVEDVAPQPGLGQVLKIVCRACLGTAWGASTGSDWACQDCGHHNAIMATAETIEKIRAEREEKIE